MENHEGTKTPSALELTAQEFWKLLQEAAGRSEVRELAGLLRGVSLQLTERGTLELRVEFNASTGGLSAEDSHARSFREFTGTNAIQKLLQETQKAF